MMNRNTIFYTLGAIIIVSFFALLIWLQNIKDDQRNLKNSYTIEIFKGSEIDSIKSIEGILAFAKSTKTVSGFITPNIIYNKFNFRIPIYGMNNLRISFDEDMYLYSGRKNDEEKFMNSKSKSFKELISEINRSNNFNCDEITKNSTRNNKSFILDPTKKSSSTDKSYWASFNELKIFIDSLIVGGNINNGHKISLYICSESYDNEIIKTVDTKPTQDTIIKKPASTKIQEEKEKIVGESSSYKKIKSVSVEKLSTTSNNFKIKTTNRSLKSTDNVQIIFRKNNSQAFSKTLNKTELKKSTFEIPGIHFKKLTHKSSLDLDLVIKINGKTFNNLGEFSIFCNQ